MAKISHAIRLKRFNVRPGMELHLQVETPLGEQFLLSVENCSLTGLSARSEEPIEALIATSIGELMPESKLVWKDGEATLGRLVLRARKPIGQGHSYGLSCVDGKVPLHGPLSHLFEIGQGEDESPLDFELSSRKFNIASFMEADHTYSDLMHKCREYALLQKDMQKNPLYQFYSVRHQTDGSRVNMSLPRVKKHQPYVHFGSYDYFGLANDPEVKEAAKSAIDKFGVSATATPPLSGRTSLHEELEFKISQMLRKEDTFIFNSGFAANVGVLTAVLGMNDFVAADILSHASIHDGLAASKAKLRLFRHNNNDHFARLMEEHRKNQGGALAVTEGLFSMDGDVPDLAQFVQVAKEHNSRIFLDEVHSFGIMGEDGRGAADRCGVLDDIDIYTGSLSKGIGAGGGFVSGSKELIIWLRHFGRAGIFSSAISPGCVAAAIKSLDLIRFEPQRRAKLLSNIKQFLDGLKQLGYDAKSDPESPIVPVIIGDQEILGIMNRTLLEHGVFTNTVIFPAVAPTASRLRFSISASHSFSDIQLALMAVKKGMEVANFRFESVTTNEKKAA